MSDEADQPVTGKARRWRPKDLANLKVLGFHGTPLHWYQWIIAGFGHREVRQIALRDHLKPSLFNALATFRRKIGELERWLA
jgi:hypothetical protein